MIKEWQPERITELAKREPGLSAREIKNRLNLEIGVRQIQRLIRPLRQEQCLEARLDELEWIEGHLPPILSTADTPEDIRTYTHGKNHRIEDVLMLIHQRRQELERGGK